MTASESLLDGRVVLHVGDSRDVLGGFAAASIDAVVCDPPYALVSIGKRFGKAGAAPAKDYAGTREGATGAYARASAGFMGQSWDTGETAFDPAFWRAVLRVLKPGGHVLAFSGTRTYHRLVVAIEDAGFEIRDQLAWVYGTGFPKSGDVAKGIDARARSGKARPEDLRRLSMGENYAPSGRGRLNYDHGGGSAMNGAVGPYVPATAEGERWQGFGTALKPAFEPIVLARKPLEGTVAENVLRYGTGALNIDGCRVGGGGGTRKAPSEEKSETTSAGGFLNARAGEPINGLGRWPANLIHDGSDEVLAAFPEAPGQQFASTTAPRKSGNVYGKATANRTVMPPRDDGGSAARFFYAVEKETRCDLCSVLLSDRNDRLNACDASTAIPSSATPGTLTGSTAHCDAAGLPPPDSEGRKQPSNGHAHVAGNRSDQCRPQSGNIAQGDALTQETSRIAPSVRSAAKLCASCETDIAQSLAATRLGLDPASRPCLESMPARRRKILRQHLALYVEGRESTDTITTTASLKTLFGSVLHAIADTTSLEKVEGPESTEPARRLFYSSKADSEDRLGSKHPTVKPLDLMQYLVRLVTPPGGLVLDPFAGTGTTGEAAFREGCRAVLVEREEKYAADIRRRMALATEGRAIRKMAAAKAKAERRGGAINLGPLFDVPARHT